MTGRRTTNFDYADSVHSILGNLTVDGLDNSVQIEIVKLAMLLLATGPMADMISEIGEAYHGTVESEDDLETQVGAVNGRVGKVVGGPEGDRGFWKRIAGVWTKIGPLPEGDTGLLNIRMTAAEAAVALRATLASPALSGIPTAPTPAPGTNTAQIATAAFVQAAIAAVVGGAPDLLNSFYELAAALGNDKDFAANMATALGEKAPKLSPTFTGTPAAPTAAPGTDTTQISTTAFVQAGLAALAANVNANKAPLASPALSGTPTAPTPAPGTNSTQIATAAFVQAALLVLSAAVDGALDLRAPKLSPTFTGTPAAPTAAPGTNTSQLANTAFVQAAIAAVVGGAPDLLNSFYELAAALGNDKDFAANMVVALGEKAPKLSPTFTGTPAAPTAAPGTDTTQISTTAFVQAALAVLGATKASASFAASAGSGTLRPGEAPEFFTSQRAGKSSALPPLSIGVPFDDAKFGTSRQITGAEIPAVPGWVEVWTGYDIPVGEADKLAAHWAARRETPTGDPLGDGVRLLLLALDLSSQPIGNAIQFGPGEDGFEAGGAAYALPLAGDFVDETIIVSRTEADDVGYVLPADTLYLRVGYRLHKSTGDTNLAAASAANVTLAKLISGDAAAVAQGLANEVATRSAADQALQLGKASNAALEGEVEARVLAVTEEVLARQQAVADLGEAVGTRWDPETRRIVEPDDGGQIGNLPSAGTRGVMGSDRAAVPFGKPSVRLDPATNELVVGDTLRLGARTGKPRLRDAQKAALPLASTIRLDPATDELVIGDTARLGARTGKPRLRDAQKVALPIGGGKTRLDPLTNALVADGGFSLGVVNGRARIRDATLFAIPVDRRSRVSIGDAVFSGEMIARGNQRAVDRGRYLRGLRVGEKLEQYGPGGNIDSGEGQSFEGGSFQSARIEMTKARLLAGVSYRAQMLGTAARSQYQPALDQNFYHCYGDEDLHDLESTVVGTTTVISAGNIASGTFPSSYRGEGPAAASAISFEKLFNAAMRLGDVDMSRYILALSFANTDATIAETMGATSLARGLDGFTKAKAAHLAAYPGQPIRVSSFKELQGQANEQSMLTADYIVEHRIGRAAKNANAFAAFPDQRLRAPWFAGQVSGFYGSSARMVAIAQRTMMLNQVEDYDYILVGPMYPGENYYLAPGDHPYTGNKHWTANATIRWGLQVALARMMVQVYGQNYFGTHIHEVWHGGDQIMFTIVGMEGAIRERPVIVGTTPTLLADRGIDAEIGGVAAGLVGAPVQVGSNTFVAKINQPMGADDTVVLGSCKGNYASLTGTPPGASNYCDQFDGRTVIEPRYVEGYTNRLPGGSDYPGAIENILTYLGPQDFGNWLLADRKTSTPVENFA